MGQQWLEVGARTGVKRSVSEGLSDGATPTPTHPGGHSRDSPLFLGDGSHWRASV